MNLQLTDPAIHYLDKSELLVHQLIFNDIALNTLN